MPNTHFLFLIAFIGRFINPLLAKKIEFLTFQLLILKRHFNETWMLQIARNITDPFSPPLLNAKFIIHDRDSKYTTQFFKYLSTSGIRPLKLPAKSPNLNAFAERFVRSLKEECLKHFILWSVDSVRHVVSEYIEFHNHERNHQGIKNEIPFPDEKFNPESKSKILRKKRLGGLLNYYYRKAA